MARGTGLAATRPGSRWPCSGTTGSSTNSGCSGASSARTRRALAAVKRPWKSTATSRSGPSTSRAAATRATTAADLGGGGERRCGTGGVHLHRGEAGLDLGGDLLGELGGLVAADPGVDPDPFADGAAQQGVHGGAVGLARDVPQGLVEAGDGAGEDGAAAVEAALGEHLPVVLDAQRVLADRGTRPGRRRRRGPPRRGPRRRVRPSRPRRRRSRRGRTASAAGPGRSRCG